jgi:hypothetical protein
MHDDRLDAHADQARSNKVGNIAHHSTHVGRLDDKPGEHAGGRVHNSMYSLVELGVVSVAKSLSLAEVADGDAIAVHAAIAKTNMDLLITSLSLGEETSLGVPVGGKPISINSGLGGSFRRKGLPKPGVAPSKWENTQTQKRIGDFNICPGSFR